MSEKDASLSLEDLQEFLEEFQSESTRAAALVGAAFLDHCLGELVAVFLVEGTPVDDLLNGFAAPLGTFHARIKVAYALGLISADEYHNLEIIRKIRNEFAHGLHGLTLDHPSIRKHVRKLKFHKGMLEAMPDHLRPPHRSVFEIVTGLLAISLHRRHKIVETQRLSSQSWGLPYPEVVGDWKPG